MTPQETARKAKAVLDELEAAVVGRRRSLELVLVGILAGGHVLLEDLPGLGKTLIARSFAQVLGLDFARIQFTPDLLPSDVTGAPLYDQRNGEMVFRPGPVFTQLLLADEINRTPPKTQAALLEAMGEGQVSVDGESRRLPQPFIVLATDNPIEYEGTYELPEAQLDRFLMRLRLGYLTASDETDMLRRRVDRATEYVALAPVTDAQGLLAMRESLERIEISDDLLDYVTAIEALQSWTRRVAAWWVDNDVLVVPTSPEPPVRLGELAPTNLDPRVGERMGRLVAFCSPFDVTGQPAVSLPLHWNDEGLPIGVQLVAAYGREDVLIRVAAQLEAARPWADRRPPVHA